MKYIAVFLTFIVYFFNYKKYFFLVFQSQFLFKKESQKLKNKKYILYIIKTRFLSIIYPLKDPLIFLGVFLFFYQEFFQSKIVSEEYLSTLEFGFLYGGQTAIIFAIVISAIEVFIINNRK